MLKDFEILKVCFWFIYVYDRISGFFVCYMNLLNFLDIYCVLYIEVVLSIGGNIMMI